MSGCIALAIWDRCSPGADLVTAQGRAALDRALRAELARIEDPHLRAHAGAILRRLRLAAFEEVDFPDLHARILRLERAMGLDPEAGQ